MPNILSPKIIYKYQLKQWDFLLQDQMQLNYQHVLLSKFGYDIKPMDNNYKIDYDGFDLVDVLNTVLSIYDYKKNKNIEMGGVSNYYYLNIKFDFEKAKYIEFTNENTDKNIIIRSTTRNKNGSINSNKDYTLFYKYK